MQNNTPKFCPSQAFGLSTELECRRGSLQVVPDASNNATRHRDVNIHKCLFACLNWLSQGRVACLTLRSYNSHPSHDDSAINCLHGPRSRSSYSGRRGRPVGWATGRCRSLLHRQCRARACSPASPVAILAEGCRYCNQACSACEAKMRPLVHCVRSVKRTWMVSLATLSRQTPHSLGSAVLVGQVAPVLGPRALDAASSSSLQLRPASLSRMPHEDMIDAELVPLLDQCCCTLGCILVPRP